MGDLIFKISLDLDRKIVSAHSVEKLSLIINTLQTI